MSMTLEEAIEQVERMHKESRSGWLYALKRGETIYAERCKKSMDEFGQLAEWLKELAERRKLPEIIYCKDCEKHNKRFDEYPADEACPLTVWRVAQEHEFDYQFCAYAERRTDE